MKPHSSAEGIDWAKQKKWKSGLSHNVVTINRFNQRFGSISASIEPILRTLNIDAEDELYSDVNVYLAVK